MCLFFVIILCIYWARSMDHLRTICNRTLHLLSTFCGPFENWDHLRTTPQKIFKPCLYSEFSILELFILPLSHSTFFTPLNICSYGCLWFYCLFLTVELCPAKFCSSFKANFDVFPAPGRMNHSLSSCSPIHIKLWLIAYMSNSNTMLRAPCRHGLCVLDLSLLLFWTQYLPRMGA